MKEFCLRKIYNNNLSGRKQNIKFVFKKIESLRFLDGSGAGVEIKNETTIKPLCWDLFQ